MHPALRPLTCLLALAASAATASAETVDGVRGGEPQVVQRSTEDEAVRIDELRVRGQTRRLSVQPKLRGFGPYEIAVPEPGRDPAQDPKAGQRIWFSLTF